MRQPADVFSFDIECIIDEVVNSFDAISALRVSPVASS